MHKYSVRCIENQLRNVDRVAQKTSAGKIPAKLTYSDDRFIRYGYNVALRHSTTSSVLACDHLEELSPALSRTKEFLACGTMKTSLRSTFVISSSSKRSKKEFVEFGDEILIGTDPALRVNSQTGICQKQLFLMSFSKGLVGNSTQSKQQEVRVALVDKCSAITWRIEPVDSKSFVNGEDKRVRSFENVQFMHCATGQALAMDAAFKVFNDYGQESEVFCTLHHQTNKVHFLKAEIRGVRTAANKVPVQERNWFTIETAVEEPCEEKSDSSFKGYLPLDPQCVLDSIRYFVSENQLSQNLQQQIRATDIANDNRLDRVELRYALKSAGLDVFTIEELDCLFDCVEESNHRSGIDIDEFLDLIA